MFMKQVKFFLVALMAVVMGMSVTSCMNGDDNHNVTMTVPVKYNYGSFLMGNNRGIYHIGFSVICVKRCNSNKQ